MTDEPICLLCGHTEEYHQDGGCMGRPRAGFDTCGCMNQSDFGPTEYGVPRAEYNRVLDQLRYLSAAAMNHLFAIHRRVELLAACDGDIRGINVFDINEDVDSIGTMLDAAVFACMDDHRHYSDGRYVLEAVRRVGDWDMEFDVAPPEAQP